MQQLLLLLLFECSMTKVWCWLCGNVNGCDRKIAKFIQHIHIANELTKCQLLLFIVISFLRANDDDFYHGLNLLFSLCGTSEMQTPHCIYEQTHKQIQFFCLAICYIFNVFRFAVNFMNLFHKSELFESSNDLQLANEDSFGIFFVISLFDVPLLPLTRTKFHSSWYESALPIRNYC